MSGYITEQNWTEIENEYPGIFEFYQKLIQKPQTFLELLWKFLGK